MIKKIALITPLNGDWAYDGFMILDGLIQLKQERPDLEFFISSDPYHKHPFPAAEYVLARNDFIDFAKNKADLILLFWCKKNTDFKLAEEISEWNKTAYVDGSEPGMNIGRDFKNQYDILRGQYGGDFGGLDDKLLKLCSLYFRREKPYIKGIIPLPYSITSVFTRYCKPNKKKDIDFFCVWGQDEYPLMRRYAQELLVDFCKKRGFTYWIEQTSTRDEFYEKLSRSKVGVSISGGGFDTARFWEILGNNCLLLTERIDIFPPGGGDLDYGRIYQFNNLYDFQSQLEKIGKFLRERYEQTDLTPEYLDILAKHSSRTRALQVVKEAEAKFAKDEADSKLCSILVTSYDGNSDLWEPFFTLFFRYWPNCPYPVYLMNNKKEYHNSRVKTLHIGGDKIWANNTKLALGKISTPYLILLIDDLFLSKIIDSNYIRRLVDYAVEKKAACIQLAPFKQPEENFQNNLNLGRISRMDGNRTSLRPAIWDKTVFNNLMRDGESAWQFEIDGVARSRNVEAPFFSAKERAINFYDLEAGVRDGKWFYNTAKVFKKEGIKIDMSKRPVDYEEGLKTRLDKLRKKPLPQKLKKIPVLGKVFSRLFWAFSELKLNKLLNKKIK